MDPLAQSKATVTKTIASLLDAGDTHQKLESLPLPSLLSAGLSQQTELVNKLSNIVLNSDAVDEQDKPAIQNLVKKNNDLTQSISLQTNYRLADDQGRDTFVNVDNLITPIYEESEDHLVHSISDTQCKHLQFFSADDHVGANLDEAVEKFLSLAFKIASQNNLSHKCAKEMICRKMSGTCKLLFSSWLETNALQEADVDLGMVCNFIESKFSLHSTPKACNIQLSNFPKVSQHNYMAQVGKICRLTRLSCRFVKDKEQRDLLAQTRSLEVFKQSLSAEDKHYILCQDRIRTEENKEPLSLMKAAQLLSTRYAEETNDIIAGSSLAQRVQNKDGASTPASPPPDQSALFIQRGRGPRNAFSRGQLRNIDQGGQRNADQRPPGQGGGGRGFSPRNPNNWQVAGRGFSNENRPFRSNNNPQNNRNFPGYQNNRNFHGNQNNRYFQGTQNNRYFPGNQNNRNNHNLPNHSNNRNLPGNTNNRQFQRPQQTNGPQRRPHITPSMVNCSPQGCLFCNDTTHSYLSPRCRFHGKTQLYSTPCRACNVGGHSTRSCDQRLRGNFRGARRLQASSDEDSGDDYDFFQALEYGSKN